MEHHPDRQNRRSLRLPDYDYRQVGAYFVTICAWGRECLFGDIVDGEMRLNELGRIADEEWRRTADIRDEIEMDAYVVMPNHLHGIVIITSRPDPFPSVGAHGRAPLQRPPKSLGSFIAGFKSSVTKRINLHRDNPGAPVWQRNYYERVIRDPDELTRIRQYIADNPALWAEDDENPANWTSAQG